MRHVWVNMPATLPSFVLAEFQGMMFRSIPSEWTPNVQESWQRILHLHTWALLGRKYFPVRMRSTWRSHWSHFGNFRIIVSQRSLGFLEAREPQGSPPQRRHHGDAWCWLSNTELLLRYWRRSLFRSHQYFYSGRHPNRGPRYPLRLDETNGKGKRGKAEDKRC